MISRNARLWLREWEIDPVLEQDRFVVVQVGPQRVAKIIGLSIPGRVSANLGANIIRLAAEDMEGVALQKEAGKASTGMPHHCGVRPVRQDLNFLNAHHGLLGISSPS